jgi:hypothetical protein
VQGRASPLRPGLAVALQLDRAGVGQRIGRLLALMALDAINHDELSTHDGRHPALRSAQVATPSVLLRCHRCCHLCAFARGRKSPTQANFVARPTGFEPVTFGSIDRGSEAYIWLYEAKPCPTGRQKVAKKSIPRPFGARRPHVATRARGRERARARHADRRLRLVPSMRLLTSDGDDCFPG